MRPSEPPLEPHRGRESHGQEIGDLGPKHAKGRAGRVVIHIQIGPARAGLGEGALPEDDPCIAANGVTAVRAPRLRR
ncbi:hypothetical protein D3C83_85410 [compost metagenome]